jgi:carboxynorspermidine decarboxylase
MLPTQSAGPGAFDQFDLNRVPTPCYVVDEEKIRSNLEILRGIADRSGANLLLALKAFSMWSLSGLIQEYLDGCCASGLWEARLAREKGLAEKSKSKILSTFSPAYRSGEINEICSLSDHLIFNQPDSYGVAQAKNAGVSVGLRINPGISLGLDPKYDPSAENSRLGYPVSQLSDDQISVFDGLHFHNLCEQNFSPLSKTWRKVEAELGNSLNQTYLEPGEAVALDAGILVGEVLDVMNAEKNHALLDISATCHAPDVIEAPYRPALIGDIDNGNYRYFLGGSSCLTADSFGEYGFDQKLTRGERVAFLDQAHYTMVKTNTFNGVPLPSIALWNSKTDELSIIKEFGYEEFENRLS